MDYATYVAEAEAEETHWWFVGRRTLFARELRRQGISDDARILDVGTSTGTNLRMLGAEGYRNFIGLDLSSDAIRLAEMKGLGRVEQGDVCRMPFEDASFDVVLATDIIEHVDNDLKALEEINRVLAPGGTALITVPAFQSLWGLQDDVARHKRRYRKGPLLMQIRRADLVVGRNYYFNYILFAPIWIARQAIGLFKVKVSSENDINTPALNRVLGLIFSLDVAIAPWLRLPFGVSILAVAEKSE